MGWWWEKWWRKWKSSPSFKKKSVESVGGEKEKCNCFVIHEIEKNKKKTQNYIQGAFFVEIFLKGNGFGGTENLTISLFSNFVSFQVSIKGKSTVN